MNVNTTIFVRETELEDAPQVAQCIDLIARERHYIASTSGYSVEDTEGYIDFLKENGGVHLVLIAASVVAGWCEVTPGVFEGLTHTGHLTMGLLPVLRGHGWGRDLLAKTLSVCFNGRFERIELEVFASNQAAIALYRSAGFRQEGRKIKARKLDGQYDDILAFGMLKEDWSSQSPVGTGG